MIDKLEFLLALAREKHFGRAAEACGVTQPTLSAGIKQLEETFGVLLVNRGSRFQDFTPEGQRVLDWARRIVGDTRAMREEVHALNRELIAAGARKFACGISPAAKAKTLRKQRDGRVLVTDGPYTETKEHMGGFWILEAADLDEALAWAKKAAIACDVPGEVRELLFYPAPEQ